MKTPTLLCADIGGSNIRIEIQTPEKNLFSSHPLPDSSPEKIIDFLKLELRNLLKETSSSRENPLHIGVSIAGMLDKERAVVLNAPNLGWKEFPLLELLRQKFPDAAEIFILNDLEAILLGELEALREKGRSYRNAAAVFLGTGLGSALLIEGELYSGSSSVAGEIGHLKVIPPNGKLCGCGGIGCVETHTGGIYLEEIANSAAETGKSPYLRSLLEKGKKLSAADLAEGAKRGDQFCTETLEKTADHLSWAISALLTIVNPELLILGGGVLSNWTDLAQRTIQFLKKWVTTPALQYLEIQYPSALGDRAGTKGLIAYIKNKGKK